MADLERCPECGAPCVKKQTEQNCFLFTHTYAATPNLEAPPMRVDSAGLAYTAMNGKVRVHYPKADGTFGAGVPLEIPPEYETEPPNGITAERIAIWNELGSSLSSRGDTSNEGCNTQGS